MSSAEPDWIPFNRPSLEGTELDYIRSAVEGGHTSASGPFTRRCTDLLREAIGAEDVLLTTSCTAALEMSAMLAPVGPGDVVIVPSFTFVTTALAYARAGASLLFADIEPDTLGIDAEHVRSLLDESVRAVVAVHYAGVGCRVDELRSVLDDTDATLIEDNAHGLFGSYRGAPLGGIGRFSTLSFHETKNFLCGEGGALVLNRAADVDRAHVLLHKGTNRRAFMLGEVDKYTWHDTGSSFGLSDVLAAYLLGQLEQRDEILAKRQHVWERYAELLAPHAERHGLRLPQVPEDRQQAYHMFHLLLPDQPTRDAAIDGLRKRKVQAVFHYVPLHTSPGGRRVQVRPTDCPVTDDVSGRLLRLPFFNSLTDGQIERVVDALLVTLDDIAGA